MTLKSSRATLLAVLSLAGCGRSPATHFLVLDAVPPAASAVRTGYCGPPVAVIAVHVPATLDRREFAQESSPGRLKISDFEQWAAPLGTLARDLLNLDLTARLPEGRVVADGATVHSAGVIRVDVVVLAFSTQPEGAAMEVSYHLLPGANGDVRRQTRLSVPVGGVGGEAATRVWANLLAQLADRIAAELPDQC